MDAEQEKVLQEVFRDGARFQQNGQLAEAAERFERFLRDKPEHRSALLNLGAVRYSLGQYEAAVVAFEKILEARDEDLDALYNLGRTYLKCQDWELASEAFQKLLTVEPADRAALLSLGYAEAGAERYTEAADNLRLYLSEDPNHRDARLSLAHCLLHLEDYSEACRLLKGLVEEDSGLKEGWAMLADAHEALGQDEKAVLALKRLVLLEGESSPLYRRLGLLYGRHNQFAEARRSFSRALELEKENTDPNGMADVLPHPAAEEFAADQALQKKALQIGSRAQVDRDFQTALKELASLSRRFPDATVLLQELGYIYQMLGEHKRAAVYYSRILEKDPRHLEARLQLLRISMLRRDPSQRAMVEETLGLFGENLLVRELAGAWFLAMEDFGESVRLFQECMDSNHKEHGVYEGIGEALIGMQRSVEAEKILVEGSQKYPDSIELVVLLADAQLRQKRTRKANATLRRARGTFDRSPRLLSLSAQAAAQSKKPERARGFYKRLSELPNSYEAGFEAMAKSLIAIRDIERLQKLFSEWSRFRMKSFSWLYVEALMVLLRRNQTRIHLVWQELWHAYAEEISDRGTELRALLEPSDIKVLLQAQKQINPFFARRAEVKEAIVHLMEALEESIQENRQQKEVPTLNQNRNHGS